MMFNVYLTLATKRCIDYIRTVTIPAKMSFDYN